MNTRAKGMRYEREVVAILEQGGYQCIRPVWNKFAAKDFFGLFDIIATHKHSPVRMVQVKGQRLGFAGQASLMNALVRFRENYTDGNVQCELWFLDESKKNWQINHSLWRPWEKKGECMFSIRIIKRLKK